MKNKFTWMILGLVIGAIVTCAVFWLCCGYCKGSYMNCKKYCSSECMTMLPGVKKISADTAHAWFVCYMKSPMKVDTLKGFLINREQLNAMNLLAEKDTSLMGFRIYMGVFGDPEDVTEVVGVASDGSDNADCIYAAPAAVSGPCPPNCDSDSPITK